MTGVDKTWGRGQARTHDEKKKRTTTTTSTTNEERWPTGIGSGRTDATARSRRRGEEEKMSVKKAKCGESATVKKGERERKLDAALD